MFRVVEDSNQDKIHKLPNKELVSECGIDGLEKVLEMAKGGDLRGFVLIYQDKNGMFLSKQDVPTNYGQYLSWIGILDVMRDSFKSILYQFNEDEED
jgi:hypothetical protein